MRAIIRVTTPRADHADRWVITAPMALGTLIAVALACGLSFVALGDGWLPLRLAGALLGAVFGMLGDAFGDYAGFIGRILGF
jgi:hypothetical protein